MPNHKPNNHIETELSRGLGLPSALAIGVGTMIAASIFTLSGLASHVALSEGRGTHSRDRFRVLVPIAKPQTMEQLIRLAAALVKEKDGELLILRVLNLPEQIAKGTNKTVITVKHHDPVKALIGKVVGREEEFCVR